MTNRPECCGTCNAFLKANEEVGFCRARPPVPIMVGQREIPRPLLQPGAQGQIEPIVLTYFPQMMPDGWCREHEFAEG